MQESSRITSAGLSNLHSLQTRTFLLVDGNHVDQFISRKILGYSGVDLIQAFHTAGDAWDFLESVASPEAIMLLDLQTLMLDHTAFIEKIKNTTKYKRAYAIYILSAIIPSVVGTPQVLSDLHLSDLSEFKGFIEKPLTVEKVNEILKKYNG